jgi:hypothetical protein
VPLPAPPARFPGEARSFGPVPRLGEHSGSVRREFLGR